jgi:hypothetical protein
VLSTPPTNTPVDPTRRCFLSQAAGVAAGGTVLALATIPPALAEHAPAGLPASPDPIFEAIEAHRLTHLSLYDALRLHSQLEDEIPGDLRKSLISVWEPKIIETDDPRWIANEHDVHHAHSAEIDAAIELVNVKPATTAGIVALLEYVLLCERGGDVWPDNLGDDDGKERSWHYFLCENIVATMRAVSS